MRHDLDTIDRRRGLALLLAWAVILGCLGASLLIRAVVEILIPVPPS